MNKLLTSIAVTAVLFGSALAVLAFGNPQWRWCYVIQAYITHRNTKPSWNYYDPNYGGFGPIAIPSSYAGLWRVWDESGNLVEIYNVLKLPSHDVVPVYLRFSGIDRRAEFGIPVE